MKSAILAKWNSRRRWAVAVLAVFLGICWAIYFGSRENPQLREQKEATACWVSINFIATAMQRYVENELYFPPNLEVLLERGYLDSPQIVTCGGSTYHYMRGARKDMPSNLPLLIETNAPHTFRYPDGKNLKYGRVLYADMSTQSFRQETLKTMALQAQGALSVMESRDQAQIAAILGKPTHHTFLEQAAALWGWRQKPDLLPRDTLEKYLDLLLDGERQIFSAIGQGRHMEGGPASRELLALFHDHGVVLSPDATVKTQVEGKRWSIEDGKNSYTGVQNRGDLDIYAAILPPDPYHKDPYYPNDPRPAVRQAIYLWQALHGLPDTESRLWQLIAEELRHPEYIVRRSAWHTLFPGAEALPVAVMSPQLSDPEIVAIIDSLDK